MAEDFHLSSIISVLLEDFAPVKSKGFVDSVPQPFCKDCTCKPAKAGGHNIML